MQSMLGSNLHSKEQNEDSENNGKTKNMLVLNLFIAWQITNSLSIVPQVFLVPNQYYRHIWTEVSNLKCQ